MSDFESFLCFSFENFQNRSSDLELSFAMETIGFYFPRAILAMDSLWEDWPIKAR